MMVCMYLYVLQYLPQVHRGDSDCVYTCFSTYQKFMEAIMIVCIRASVLTTSSYRR